MRKGSLWGLLGAAFMALSQTPDKGVIPNRASAELPGGRESRVAVVVGIDHYAQDSGFASLKWAQNDAAEMAATLERLGYVVQRIPEEKATAAEILRTIGEQGKMLIPVRGNEKQGTFLFYFSGHGTSSGNNNYLITTNTSRNRLTREALGMDEVERELGNTPARRKILLIDACRTAPKSDGARGVDDNDRFAAFQAAEGERILLAAPFGEPSREFDELKHGAFTYFLLQSLNSKSLITFRQLADTVSLETRTWTHAKSVTQVPKELGEATFDFAIAGDLSAQPAAPAASLLSLGRAQRVKRDYAAALATFTKGAGDGNAEAMFEIGQVYAYGQGVPRDYGQAMTWYRKAADAKVPAAMSNIGELYENGLGVKLDYKEAMGWYLEAANAGDSAAMANLAQLYERRKVVPQLESAVGNWYRNALTASQTAAKAGDVRAMVILGYLYKEGKGVAQNYQEAMAWSRKAAEAGDPAAMENVGALYYNGYGVNQDYREAMNWFRKSADAGDSNGMNSVGLLYAKGWGVTQDDKEALRWYRQAAEAGNSTGMYAVGYSYEYGRVVGKDRDQAIWWYRKAVAAGDDSSKAALKRLGVQ